MAHYFQYQMDNTGNGRMWVGPGHGFQAWGRSVLRVKIHWYVE